jgi:2,3-dihydroxybenzoate decarboxylase
MNGKIAIEEHFAIAETTAKSARYPTKGYWADLHRQLIDFHDERLAQMDAAGIEIAVLSLNSPAVQGVAVVAEAVALARKANDVLAEQIARRPDRLAGLAALPMQDPQAAAEELGRCVRELGLKGALVNGFAPLAGGGAAYYDTPSYLPFWAEVERLGVPFYLHPRDPLPARLEAYEGHPWLVGSPWGFAEEASLHALRLIGSGLFDVHPRLQIILGHLGERIPYDLWRLDHRLTKVPGLKLKRTMGEYFRANFYLTTSGHFSTHTLLHAMMEMGVDRILFSVDYPFEDNGQAAAWFDVVEIAESERLMIGRSNAIALLGLRAS